VKLNATGHPGVQCERVDPYAGSEVTDHVYRGATFLGAVRYVRRPNPGGGSTYGWVIPHGRALTSKHDAIAKLLAAA
jgi:hypothetical protein